MDASQPRADVIPLKPVSGGGMIRFLCHEDDCGMLSDLIHVAVEPVLTDDDMHLVGIVQYDSCPHYLLCEHMATRVGLILDAMETQSLTRRCWPGWASTTTSILDDEDSEEA